MAEPTRTATHAGDLKLGEISIPCAVLEDGTRVISETGVLNSLGLYRSGAVHVRARDAGGGGAHLPLFIAHKNLKAFVDEELATVLLSPIWYRPVGSGTRHKGVRAQLIPKICEVWLRARDAGVLGERQKLVAAKADILMRGLANVGVIALIDEATGYQAERDRDELQKILAAYIAKELLPWTQRFPEEFYREMFRLRGWQFHPMSGRGPKGPRYAGKLTNELIYKKLPPGVLEELRKLNPPNEKYQRKYRHTQLLTGDIGNPHLEKHVAVVTTLMRISPNWRAFERNFYRAFPPPRMAEQQSLFPTDDESEEETDGES
jgi:hypothetical protein